MQQQADKIRETHDHRRSNIFGKDSKSICKRKNENDKLIRRKLDVGENIKSAENWQTKTDVHLFLKISENFLSLRNKSS